MSQSAKSRNLPLRIFGVTLGITILIWLLRGLRILTFIPSGLIWLLLLLAIATGIWARWQRRWSRF